MQQLSKIVTRQDANFKLSPSASNETSINLSKEISALISEESGDVTFTLYKSDFIKALSALCLIPKIYFKKEQQPSKLWSIFHELSQQIESQFGDAESSIYTVFHFKRDDGRAYFNNLKSANGFNLRAFLVEQFAVLTFERSDDGKLFIRLNIDAPREETPHINIVEEEPIIDDPLQVIYYGAPGTGKSFTIDNKADDARTVRTTFHPDSDYASFVGAYKPTMENVDIYYVNSDGDVKFAKGADNNKVDKGVHPGTEKKIVYKYVPQAFLKAYVAAWSDLTQPYFLVIEEINRGNCAQIFGDLFQLLDRNNSGSSSYAIHADEDIAQFLSFDDKGFAALSDEQKDAIRSFVLTKDSGNTVAIGPEILSGNLLLLPPNLYIWATMNTSDQSLFPIDSAFKRRWNWRYMPIETDKENWTFEIKGTRYSWGQFLENINPEIYSLTESSDKKMGYYFAKADPKTGVISEEVFLNKVLFYLWTDVFKDYDVSSELFKSKKLNRSFIFTDFFDKNYPEALEDFIANLGLTPIGEAEVENTANTDAATKRSYGRSLIIKFPDGTVIKGDTQFDSYMQALQRIGLDKAADVIAKKGYSRNQAPLISKEKHPAIENSSTFSYVQSGDYFIIKGIDTMEGTLKGISNELGLGLEVYFE